MEGKAGLIVLDLPSERLQRIIISYLKEHDRLSSR